MLLFLYGKDSFRSQRKLKQIIIQYQKTKKHIFNLRIIDLKKDSFGKLRDEFRSRSIFKERKLFILKNALSNSDFRKKFLESKKEFLESENTIIFYEREKILRESLFFKFLKKNSQFQEFKLLKEKELKVWVREELNRYQADIKPIALNLLISYVGSDLWRLSNELRKLIDYRSENNQNVLITKKDVELLVYPDLEKNIFKTIEAIAAKQKRKAISFLHQHLDKGDSPFYLLSMVAFQLGKLLIIKDQDLRSKNIYQLGWHPYFVKKTYRLSQGFSFKDLKRAYQKIAQIDLEMKTGKIDPETALDLFVAQI